ncbi:MAG: manganese efflux pump MntP [Henriciella sp.]
MIALFLLSLALSTDAFAASIARGVRARERHFPTALGSGLIFGTTEGVMCLLGWIGGSLFAGFIARFDHWVALILLGIIGARMVREGLQHDSDGTPAGRMTVIGTLVTAIGTSIDSATVGVALALAGTSAYAAIAIGGASFLASTVGFMIGPMLGARFGHRAEIAGGSVLIMIGIFIFYEHAVLGAG